MKERVEKSKPWGSHTVLAEGSGYKIKYLEIRPQQKLSLQLHDHRSEHWIVLEGRARITCGDHIDDYGPNAYVYIPKGARHRIENITEGLVRIIEVQRGDNLSEDDIVRLGDLYGRAWSLAPMRTERTRNVLFRIRANAKLALTT